MLSIIFPVSFSNPAVTSCRVNLDSVLFDPSRITQNQLALLPVFLVYFLFLGFSLRSGRLRPKIVLKEMADSIDLNSRT